MPHLHPRIVFLGGLLGLNFAQTSCEDALRELVLHHLEEKCTRLVSQLPRLSRTAVEETIAQACGISKWHLLIHELATPGCFEQLPARRWTVTETLPVAMDASNSKLPLTDGQRVYARHFAKRLAKALALEQPDAHDIAARLYGAERWLHLVGEVPPVPPGEALYTYRESAPDSSICWFLRPSRGCARLTAELDAVTRFVRPEAAAHAARDVLVRRPEFLTAARIAVDALLKQGATGEALACTNRTFRALRNIGFLGSLRLAPARIENVDYYRLRCARIIALTHLERFDDAAQVRAGLVSELDAVGTPGAPQVARWLSDYDTWQDPCIGRSDVTSVQFTTQGAQWW
ncbi:conserved protein of unknown function [Burkholderia multivorans]